MTVPPDPEALTRFNGLLQSSNSILFITGAGISADSGLPTYRGIGGLYNSQDTDDGVSIEEALSGEMLRQRPEITWKYLWQIAAGAESKTYNRAHQVIAELEAHKQRVWVVTQNIDGFHTAAGSRNVIEIHGNMRGMACLNCRRRFSREHIQGRPVPPRCIECQGVLRPDVVLFGEALPRAAIDTLSREIEHGFDLVVSIGTSSVFPYIVEPVFHAVRQGIPTVEINPSPRTAISDHVNLHLPLRAIDVLK